MGRVENGDLNLQPDFQRGEVWGPPKKRRLIDSILREWHIPPVHVIVDPESERLEVLDGQQRLAAIRDFFNNELAIDGSFKPTDERISKLDGLVYEQLPQIVRRRFENYTIRIIRIEDFTPEEPGELFYRLNQPTNLTSAEQRNAFYGPSRRQVKELVSNFESYGLNYSVLGFKNARMAYDDIVAKVCCCLHLETLNTKITAGLVTEHYRSAEPFSDRAVQKTDFALGLLGKILNLDTNIKFNKATIFSWLIFLSQFEDAYRIPPIGSLSQFLLDFENTRQAARGSHHQLFGHYGDFQFFNLQTKRNLVLLFNDRASSRVADVSSVILRDFIIWVFYLSSGRYEQVNLGNKNAKISRALSHLEELQQDPLESDFSERLSTLLIELQWGAKL
jgi:hypothetical protein